MSGDVPAGVAAHSQQLARLIAHSERHSVSSYNRPLTAATQEELRTEVTSKAILTRLTSTHFVFSHTIGLLNANIELG